MFNPFTSWSKTEGFWGWSFGIGSGLSGLDASPGSSSCDSCGAKESHGSGGSSHSLNGIFLFMLWLFHQSLLNWRATKHGVNQWGKINWYSLKLIRMYFGLLPPQTTITTLRSRRLGTLGGPGQFQLLNRWHSGGAVRMQVIGRTNSYKWYEKD